jgi:hypothetical protein
MSIQTEQRMSVWSFQEKKTYSMLSDNMVKSADNIMLSADSRWQHYTSLSADNTM